MRENKHELSKYTVRELNQILKSIEEMITIPNLLHNIPFVNKWNLKREQLFEMKGQLIKELESRIK